jgi:hypothetical protein
MPETATRPLPLFDAPPAPRAIRITLRECVINPEHGIINSADVAAVARRISAAWLYQPVDLIRLSCAGLEDFGRLYQWFVRELLFALDAARYASELGGEIEFVDLDDEGRAMLGEELGRHYQVTSVELVREAA